jgi:hypothetical protein
MPANPSAPYDTGANILALVQDLCRDPQGQQFTAIFCLQAINSAARWLGNELRNRGKATLVEDEYVVTIPGVTEADPTQQVYLTFTGITGNVTAANTPTLPQDLIEPLKLWERPSGMKTTLREMRNWTDKGGLPKSFQREYMRDWEWRTDQICFIGALNATDIIIRYSAVPFIFSITDMGSISGSLGDIEGIDPVAYYAASQLIPKLGGAALGAQYRQEAQNRLEQLSTDVTRAEQMATSRMMPYGGQRGGWGRRLY